MELSVAARARMAGSMSSGEFRTDIQ